MAGGSGAVFFLGARAHYQVLEQPNYDTDTGHTSTETIYQNTSVEEVWPNEQTDKTEAENIDWNFGANDAAGFYGQEDHASNRCIKRRNKRPSSEALLSDDMKPASLNQTHDGDSPKLKNRRRSSVLQFLTSLSRRKRRPETQHLKHMECGVTACTYRESCRCIDCQSRYFECAEDSEEDYSSEEDYDNDLENPLEPTDEQFLDPGRRINRKLTDLVTEKKPEAISDEKADRADDGEPDKQLQLEVAASTSAMLNLLLYHPFSCEIQ